MKIILKRTLAILLAVVMMVGAAPAAGLAGIADWISITASAANYSGTCGENGSNLTWSLDTSTGVLTISGTGKMKDYISSSYVPWYSYRSYIKTLTIGNSVTSIGDYAFDYCKGLTSVTIPNSVTSIGEGAFFGCEGLTSITIPNSVTSIGARAFEDCTGLTSITIPNSVTSIGAGAFEDCTGLTSITIPNSVTSIGEDAFYGCEGLTSVTIPNSVKSIGECAFQNCTGLKNITIPNSVTSIGSSAFQNCTGLTSVTIPNSVKSIGEYAFNEVCNIVYNGTESGSPWGARSLNGYVDGYVVYESSKKKTLLACSSAIQGGITIPNSVTSIGSDAFSECTGLTSITIPNSVKSIGDSAFRYCTGLTSITIPNSVTSIGSSAFFGCTGLTSYTVDKNNANYSSDEYGALYNKDKTELIQYPIGNNRTAFTVPNSVTSIGNGAFEKCTGLTSVTIGNSVTSIGSYAFEWCSELKNITIHDSVTSIGLDAFYSTPLYYNKNNWTDGVLYIGKYLIDAQYSISGTYVIKDETLCIADFAFSGCTGLTNIIIPNSVTSIGDFAFFRCTGLTSVTIPDSVTSIGGRAFDGCTGLISVNFNAVNCTITGVFGSLFSDCKALKNVVIGKNVKSVPDDIFIGCTGLTNLTISDGVTSIGNYTFGNCTGLTSLTIPDSVTRIGDGAFQSGGYTSVTIGKGVTSIGNSAFYSDTKLKDVYYPGTQAQWAKINIEIGNDCLTNATIHYNSSGGEVEEPSLSFGQDIYYMAVGETLSILPKATLSGSYSLIWKSNDPSIASVTRKTNTVSSALAESYGVVQAKSQGYTVLTATTSDGMYEARCLIYVGNKVLFVTSDGEIEKNKVGTYNIGLVDRGGIIKDNAHGFALANYCHASDDELSDISFVIADPAVASLESVQKTDGYIQAKIKGLKAGTTYFTVTNRNTGEAKYVQIAIHDTECTYRADAMPKTTKKGGIFNFSKNFLRVYDFDQTVKSNGDRDVTFNVYSSASNVGSVDVYDADGNVVNSFRVEPCTSNNPTSIKEHIGTAYNLVKMFVVGDPFGETQEIVSKKTEISTTIPANGYIKITNDVQSSYSCMIYNTVDVSIYLLEALAGTIIDATEEELSKEIKEKLSADILWNIMRQLGIENEQSGAKTVMKHITGLTKELVKSADKLDEKNFLKLVDELCKDCNIDFVDYLITTVESVTKSAIKAGFKAAAKMNPGTEAAVKAFECMYKGAKWLNFGEMIIDINRYYMQGAAYIYNDQSGSVRISNGIRLEGAKSDEIVFRTYEITGGAVYDSLANTYQDSKLFDIALVKNNQVSQPDSTVKVFIPVPENWNGANVKVYRINEDGTKTDMNAKAEFAGDYMVFTTNHFSYYALVMEESVQPTVNIRNFTANKTVDYKTTITFTDEVKNAVSGATVHWFIDGQDKGTGDTYTVTKAKKSYTVQVKYIKDGKVLAESGVESVNVKTGFFAKLAAFFRSIFGALPKVVQGYLGVEIMEKYIP